MIKKNIITIVLLFIIFFIPNINIVYAADLATIDGVPLKYMPIDINYTKDVTIEPKYIVIHDTDNRDTGANAENNRGYFANHSEAKASTQFIVDDTEIVQALPETALAWHIGDGVKQTEASNSNSIGIEVCVNSDGNFGKAFQNDIVLTRYLMKKYNIPVENVIRHYDATKKICPRMMIEDDPSLWTKFKESISKTDMPIENNNDVNIEDMEKTATQKKKAETLEDIFAKYKEDKYTIPKHPNGRIVNTNAIIQEQPSNDSAASGVILQGTLIEVVETIGNSYCKIIYNDIEVYIPYEDVALLNEYKFNEDGKVGYAHNVTKFLTKLFSLGIIGEKSSGYGRT